MKPNYYTLLGVTSRASTSEIKRAYRRMARQHHPDVNAQAENEHIKRVNEAYAVLSDSRKRQRYDELLRQLRQRSETARREQERAQREQEKAQRGLQMTWMQGAFGFVRELKEGLHDENASRAEEQPRPQPQHKPSHPQQQEPQREPKMTWAQGMAGFVRELKKDMRDDG